MSWPAPDSRFMSHVDNIKDHLDHDVVHWADVTETNRITIDPTTERCLDEGDLVIYVVKNLDSQTTKDGLVCHTCERDLDVPNDWQWAL